MRALILSHNKRCPAEAKAAQSADICGGGVQFPFHVPAVIAHDN